MLQRSEKRRQMHAVLMLAVDGPIGGPAPVDPVNGCGPALVLVAASKVGEARARRDAQTAGHF
jgi:hypothetical protein